MAFQSQTATNGSWSTEAPDDFDWGGDEDGYWPVSRLRQCYVDYLTAKIQEYEEQRQARHYYNGAQWTPEEVKVLRGRRQPIITFNEIGKKVDQIVGMVQRLRQDPKAFPRNPKNADGAEIATQCVRAVLDSADWEFIDPYCAGQAGIEGIAGIELKLVQGDHADPDVGMDFVFGDDWFYDPRSFKPDFSDARYMGIAKWLDVEAAIELFPDKEEELRTLMVETGFDLTTHSDREYKWIYVNEKRLRLVEIWYQHKGKWYWAFFCSMLMLDQGLSPFLDERNRPMNRFVMFSAYVDHDGDRYGFPRNLKGPQDEVNQRRSKALHMSNVTRVIAQKGVVDDVEKARRELARPDGFVEVNPGFEIPTEKDKTQDLAHQLALMQDARTEIQSFANIMPDLLGREVPGDHSGVAINMLQKAGIAELGPYLRNYKAWKKRVYKAIWNIVNRTWQEERFIRVTDNQGLAQFIQVNGMGQNDYGEPIIINAIGGLDVEITIDEGPDEANLMQDAYDVLKQYPPGVIPPQVLIELSPLSASMKKQVMQMLTQQPPPDPLAQRAKEASVQRLEAEVEEKHAGTVDRKAGAIHRIAQANKVAAETHSTLADIVRDDYLAVQGDTNTPQGGPPKASPAAANQPAQQPQGPQQGVPQMPLPVTQQPQPPVPMTPVSVPHNHPILAHARQAPDGNHYVRDPRRPGKFLRVA